MDFIAIILWELFSQLDISPKEITEMEVSTGLSRGQWYIHLQPEFPWFVLLAYIAGEWRAETHDYM